ncbi:hypothetical protein DNTS_004104 [Danionella cerebrum]|uniref:Uncharacterized protein n=1 Tax=Danionella cerebrum TaxID=2873325 RepID=A0A553MUI1_9TELE|nr:hypothetical protein DNTS_004104 [Danionella translucida]
MIRGFLEKSPGAGSWEPGGLEAEPVNLKIPLEGHGCLGQMGFRQEELEHQMELQNHQVQSLKFAVNII